MTQKERKVYGAIAFVVTAFIGVFHYFFGEAIISFVLAVLEVVLHWIIGATIVLALIAMLCMIFFSEKQIEWLCDDSKRTMRERKEQEIIEEYFNEKTCNRERDECES